MSDFYTMGGELVPIEKNEVHAHSLSRGRL
jgi:hypothetical protein